MPKNTTTEDVSPQSDATTHEVVTISKSELEALKHAAEQSLKTAIAATVPAGVDASIGQSIAEAFAKTFAPMMETFTSAQRATTERVLDAVKDPNDFSGDPKISAFNLKGDRDFPRPSHFKLVNGKPRKVFFCGSDQSSDIDRMTVEEIAAYDAFTEDCECRKGTWRAVIRSNGTDEVLDIILPKNDPDKVQQLPGLLDILYELRTKGKKFPDANVVLTKMLANATDPDAFIANLERLLAQSATQ